MPQGKRRWSAADDGERVPIEELTDSVTVFQDHLEVRVGGVPPLNVLYSKVGLKESENGVSEEGRARSGTKHWRLAGA